MVATPAAHQCLVESGQSSFLVQWSKSWDTIGWQMPSDRTVVTGDWPRQTRSSLVVYSAASPPSSSRFPPPPDCFYFLRISISSFIYLFVINLNDPRIEAGLEEWLKDDGRLPGANCCWGCGVRGSGGGQWEAGVCRAPPMEPGCPIGGGGYPLSGAPGWGGRSRGEGGWYSAGRRGVAVAGRGCPSEREAPSGGRDQRP